MSKSIRRHLRLGLLRSGQRPVCSSLLSPIRASGFCAVYVALQTFLPLTIMDEQWSWLLPMAYLAFRIRVADTASDRFSKG